MRATFIGSLMVLLPKRAIAEAAMTSVDAAILNEIHHARITSRLRYMLAKGTITKSQLQQKANQLSQLPLTASADDDANDPVLLEAITIAKEMLTAEAEREGLPMTKTINLQAQAVATANPALREKALERLAARYQAMQTITEATV